LLLDSHALIWWVANDRRLSKSASKLIEDADCLVSVASAYEIGVKVRLGKFENAAGLIADFRTICANEHFDLLPLSLEHALKAASFASPHRDPFDRMLAAQSVVEDIPILSVDELLESFGCLVLW
jgi:PIN domain nuclease of toxin-antitoxin system